MEYRKRTLSSALDDDVEKQRRRTASTIDDQLDEYSDYIYTGSFNIFSSIIYGFKNLICPCLYKKREPITVND
jgi:hypothetical protein